jgi:hypothetical protein
MSEVFIGGRGELSFYNLTHQKFDRKIRVRRKVRGIGKYFFVNRTIKLWNQLPAEVLATFPCKSRVFRMRLRKVIIS